MTSNQPKIARCSDKVRFTCYEFDYFLISFSIWIVEYNVICSLYSLVTSPKHRSRTRITSNKVFADLAEMGKSTMGWFHGFKLHIVINDGGEILSFASHKLMSMTESHLKTNHF